MTALQESIRPSADLRNHYSDISRQCREDNEAVIITVNGRGDTVSMAYEQYKRLKAYTELLEMLIEAENDVRDGRTSPAGQTFERLQIDALSQTPEIGIVPADSFLRRNGFRVLITEKDLVFYKVNKEEMTVTVYAVTDQRQDYISIVSG